MRLFLPHAIDLGTEVLGEHESLLVAGTAHAVAKGTLVVVFALIFLFGAAYTLKHNEHVRVDVLYQSPRLMNPRRRAWVDLLGTLFFLIPFCLLVITGSFPFVEGAWNTNEGSPDPGGLPARWLLKAAIPVGFTMLLLQGIAMMIRSAQSLLCHSYEYQPSGNNPPDDQSRGDRQESQH